MLVPPFINSELTSLMEVTTVLTTVFTTSGMVAIVAATVDKTANVAVDVNAEVGVATVEAVMGPIGAGEVVVLNIIKCVVASVLVVGVAIVEVNMAVAKVAVLFKMVALVDVY